MKQHLARVRVPDEFILRVRLELLRQLNDELLEEDGVKVLGEEEDEEPVPELGLLHQDIHALLKIFYFKIIFMILRKSALAHKHIKAR